MTLLKGDDYLRYQLVFLLERDLIGRSCVPTRDVGFPSKLGTLGSAAHRTRDFRD